MHREFLFSNFEHYITILQLVKNKCVRFGGHVGIQVSYKIFNVGSTKEGPNFAQSTLLSRGVALRQLRTLHGLGCLGVKVLEHIFNNFI